MKNKIFFSFCKKPACYFQCKILILLFIISGVVIWSATIPILLLATTIFQKIALK